MRDKKDSKYYKESSIDLGWGDHNQPIDLQREKLLKKYLTGKNVLDVGCGLGNYTDFIARIGFKATGLDFVKEFIESAKKRYKGTYVLGDGEKLPFKNKEFDTTILFDILEHVDDLKLLNEVIRVTKKRILVIVPKKVDKVLEQSGVIFRHYIDKSHLREYQKKDLEKLAASAKLKVNVLEEVHPLYNETIFSALFEGNEVLKKIVRKITLTMLAKKLYNTEIFAVYENNRT